MTRSTIAISICSLATIGVIAVMLLSSPAASDSTTQQPDQDASTEVLELYFSSVAYPEAFDTSIEIQEANGPSNQLVVTCLEAIHAHYHEIASTHLERCRAHAGNTDRYWACAKNNPEASLATWSNDMLRAIEDGVAWTETNNGLASLRAKRIAETQQPGLWVRAVRHGIPQVQQMLSCP